MDTPIDALRLAAAELRFGLISPEIVVRGAAHLRAELPDNGPLAELTETEPLFAVVLNLLESAIEAVGEPVPEPGEAGRIVIGRLCQAILDGELGPAEGARSIWWNVVRQEPSLRADFGHFVGLATEWQDDPAHRDRYEAEILAAAERGAAFAP